jgi:hypothetical protein
MRRRRPAAPGCPDAVVDPEHRRENGHRGPTSMRHHRENAAHGPTSVRHQLDVVSTDLTRRRSARCRRAKSGETGHPVELPPLSRLSRAQRGKAADDGCCSTEQQPSCPVCPSTTGWGREGTRGHQRSGPLSLKPPRIGAFCGVLAGQELFGGRRAPHLQGARPRQQQWPAYEGLCWSMRTIAPEARPATASWSAVAACASGRVAATWSQSSPCARSSTSASSRAPSART